MAACAYEFQMLSAFLDILMPERTIERHQETLRRGLVRLQQPLPSDSDPINRRLPEQARV
jgi:hypothetical protein